MFVAFYKGEGNFFDKLIRWKTRSQYSHCELVFSDGVFFSADPRDKGVRYKNIALDPTKWDFKEVHLDTFAENVVRRYCDSKVGRKYDWLGIVFCHVLKLGVEDAGRFFCSEICGKALQQADLLRGYNCSEFDPGDLSRKV